MAAAGTDAEERAARLVKRAREHAEQELHDAEIDLARARLAYARPTWIEDFPDTDLDELSADITDEWLAMRALQVRAEARPNDHRIVSEMRGCQARLDCWTATLTRLRIERADRPGSHDAAAREVAEAERAVEAARSARAQR